MLGIGRGGPPGVVAVRVAAKHPLLPGGLSIRSRGVPMGPRPAGPRLRGAHAPHINPPGAARGRTQRGALFLPGLIPGALRSLAQFPMDFLGVVMRPQGVNGWMGHLDFGNLFAGEIGRLPSEIQSGEAAQSTGLRKPGDVFVCSLSIPGSGRAAPSLRWGWTKNKRKHKLNHVPGLTHGLDQKSEPGHKL